MYSWVRKIVGSDSVLLQQYSLHTYKSRCGDNRFCITSWLRARICQSSCMALSNYSHLSTYFTSIYVVCSTLSILSQAREFVNTKLEMIPSCWAPWSGAQVDNCVEIRKQTAFQKTEEPRPEPEEKTVTVSNVTEEAGLTEAGINVFRGIDSNKQRAMP